MIHTTFENYFQDNPLLSSLFHSSINYQMTNFYLTMLTHSVVHNYPVPSVSNGTHIKLVLHSILRLMRLLKNTSYPFYFKTYCGRSYWEIEHVCVLAAMLHDVVRLYKGDLTMVQQILRDIFSQVPSVNTDEYISMILFVLKDFISDSRPCQGETFLLHLSELLDVGSGRFGNSTKEEPYMLSVLRGVRNIRIANDATGVVTITVTTKGNDVYYAREIVQRCIHEYGFPQYFKIMSQ